MFELCEVLVVLKGLLGNVFVFCKVIESILKDEQQCDLVLGELKIEG